MGYRTREEILIGAPDIILMPVFSYLLVIIIAPEYNYASTRKQLVIFPTTPSEPEFRNNNLLRKLTCNLNKDKKE